MLSPSKDIFEAGCDEASRGALAGPVFASAVILPFGFDHPLLDDSEKMTENNRNIVRSIIEEKAIAWAAATVTAQEIDRFDVLQASILAMKRAVDKSQIKPEVLLIDGDQWTTTGCPCPCKCVVKGDSEVKSIAAASVLAQTHRDEHTRDISSKCPWCDWPSNKGCPTERHRDAMRRHGLCEHHRRSFKFS